MIHETLTPVADRAKGYDDDARCVDCEAIAIHNIERNSDHDAMCHAHFVRRFEVCTECMQIKEREEIVLNSGLCGPCFENYYRS